MSIPDFNPSCPISPPTIADPTGATTIPTEPMVLPWSSRLLWGTVVPVGLIAAGIVLTWKFIFMFIVMICAKDFHELGVWVAIAVFVPIGTVSIAAIGVSSVMNSFLPWKRRRMALLVGVVRPLAVATLAIGLLVGVCWIVVS